MKPDELLDAIGAADEELVAKSKPKKHRHLTAWITLAAACLCLVIGIFTVARTGSQTALPAASDSLSDAISEAGQGQVTLLSSQDYPEMAAYPNYEDYVSEDMSEDERMDAEEAYEEALWQTMVEERDSATALPSAVADGLNAFTNQTLSLLLESDGSDNQVYSPLNLYYALAMLSELVDGETQSELLSLLGLEEATLSETLSQTFLSLYQNDGVTELLPANSLWFNSTLADSLKLDTLEQLAADCYASSYAAALGTDEADSAIASWLSEQTGGLLDQQAQSIETDESDLLCLFSTLYFHSPWASEFYAEENTQAPFTCGDGSSVEATYMNQTDDNSYVLGENYRSSSLALKGYDSMYFILPDEGSSVSEVLSNENLLEEVLSEDSDYGEVVWSVPKFDVTETQNLSQALTTLGQSSLFDGSGDFSPLSDTEGIALSGALQCARVQIDEVGVTAASFTQLGFAGAEAPQGYCEMTLNRPFIFLIVHSFYDYESGEATNLVLYAGVVNGVE